MLKNKFILICILFAINFSYNASNSTLPKQELVPGGVAILEIPINTQKVTYNNKKVLILNQNNKKYAIIGIPLYLEDKLDKSKKLKQKIIIYNNKNKKSFKYFNIEFKQYPTSEITIKNTQMVTPDNKNLKKIIKDQALLKQSYNSYNIFPNNYNNFDTLIIAKPTNGIASSSFGSRRIINNIKKNPHKGMDIAASLGSIVISPKAGKVILAKNLFLPGNTVIIDHGMGFKTLYAHLDKIFVKNNQIIKSNGKIGTVGNTGRVTGPHLHWSVILNGEAVNPKLFLE